MARDPKHDILFEPIQIGPKTLKNRFYQVPHCNGFGSEKPFSQAYFRALKAEGGWGAVCTEYCSISPESDDTHRMSAPHLGRRRHQEPLADVRHAPRARLPRRRASSGTAARTRPAWSRAASRAARRRSRATSSTSPYAIEADKDDIRYRPGAATSRPPSARATAGFDIVYVYGSHSYLPQQFLTPFYNQRTDEYGGSFENRARFWRETIEQVKEAVGDDCAIAVRMSTDMFMGEAGTQLEARLPRRSSSSSTTSSTCGTSTSPASPSGARTRRRRASTRQGAQLPVAGRGEGGHEEAGASASAASRTPTRWSTTIRGGQLDIIGACRPVDRRPVPAEEDRRGPLDDIRECIGCNVCISRWRASAARRSSARRTRPPARSTAAAGTRSASRRRRTPTTTCSSSAPARRDGVRDDPRQARHAPRAPRRGRAETWAA